SSVMHASSASEPFPSCLRSATAVPRCPDASPAAAGCRPRVAARSYGPGVGAACRQCVRNLRPEQSAGFVAENDAALVGALTYRLGADVCEVITLNSLAQRQGVGTALMAAAKERAGREHCRLWPITTNDNINAIRFYQRLGMDMVALHRNFAEQVRRHKPVDQAGDGGVEFKHAIDFAYEPRV